MSSVRAFASLGFMRRIFFEEFDAFLLFARFQKRSGVRAANTKIVGEELHELFIHGDGFGITMKFIVNPGDLKIDIREIRLDY